MKIVHTVSSLGEWAGGPPRSVTNLASAVADLGHKVELVAGYSDVRDHRLLLPQNKAVGVHLVNATQIGPIAWHRGFRKAVNDLIEGIGGCAGDVIVHDNGVWGLTNIATALAARDRAVPYVLHSRGMLEPWALGYRKAKKEIALALYQRRIIEGAAVLIATSEQERKNLRRMFPNIPVAEIPNGTVFPCEVVCRSYAADRPKLLFMSRIHPVKNVLGLVRAWREICAEPSRANWTLQIAGPDELGHTKEVMALVRSFGLENRVEFLGPVREERKQEVLESASLFVLPSFTENFGIAVAEALAYGIPVIASRGTPWEGLTLRGCGWWVDPKPEALSAAILEATGLSEGERRRRGEIGREYARSSFSWSGVGRTTERLYEWVLRREAQVPPFVYV